MRKNKIWKPMLYIGVFLLFVAALIYGGFLIVESTVYSKGVNQEEEWTSKTISVDGVEYFPRQDITVVMALGIDEEGPVVSSGSYRNHGEADTVMLLILDHAEESIRVLCLNRDTMVHMPVLGIDGRDSGITTYAQLALSHTYGKGLEDSCENTKKTISALLGNIVIDHYIAMNMDGIAVVNDAVGGVTVNITDDFSAVDPSLPMGEVKLLGEQALSFIRTRKDVGNQLNISRMNRHQHYIESLLEAMKSKLKEDDAFSTQVYEELSSYMVTDCSVKVISRLMERCSGYTLKEIVSPAGENILGEEYYEFYVDEEELDALVIRLFYAPK